MERSGTPSAVVDAARWSASRARAVAWVALVVALVYFAWRGIWRGIGDGGDLAVGFAAARAWLQGVDPYDPAVLRTVLAAAGGGDLATGSHLDVLRNVFFPPTILGFVPVAALPWGMARLAFLVIDVAAVAGIVLGLLRWTRTPIGSTASIALAASVFALGPIHTTLSLGQPAVVSVAAIVAGLLLDRSSHPRAAGLAFGLATILKVQIGLPFLAWLVWRRRWTATVTAAALVALTTLVAVGRMALGSGDWLGSWLTNLADLSGPGGINDPSALNPDRYSLINLQYLVSSIIPDDRLVTILTFVAVGLVALALVAVDRRRPGAPETLIVALVAVLTLLVSYHRFYDAALLVLPIAWAWTTLATSMRWFGIAVLVLSADFIVGTQVVAYTVTAGRTLPGGLEASPLWTAGVLAQHVWALVAMAVILLWAAVRSPRHAEA